MLFRVLGPLEVETDDVPITVSGARPRALLIALLLEPNAVVPAHRLVEALWPGRQPDDPTNGLHQVVRRLRAQLGPAAAAVLTRPPGYLLRIEPAQLDATCFETEYRQARELRSADPARAAALLERALARWRGPAYGEFSDGFALAAAVGLEELRIAALEDRVALQLESGFAGAAVAGAQDLVVRQPLRERPVELLMRALHADGRTGEALAAYQRHRTVVADELGLDPAAGLRELEARILRDEIAPPPAAAATAPPRSEVPWRPGPLLGREQELDLLVRCLPAQRVVTLVGPGGVGKTRLALEAAHHLVDAGHPVWWVDLGPVTASRVVDALAAATRAEVPRAPGPAGADPVAALAAALRAAATARPPGVLCLDNAEHLLDVLATIVERLVDGPPGLAVLTTSRERLAVAPEHVHLLTPLALPAGADRDNAAVRLFVDRAPGLEPDAMGDDDVAAVAEVCRRLDGLPLAIELGAARAATFGIRGLAARLGDRLDLLGGGRRTAAARHRTLRAVVDWSHELLTDAEATVFARLAVFPGAFSLDQAEAVCADEHLPRPALAPLLAQLVERSLVQAGQGWFWLLETLRTYAAERTDAAGGPQLRARHARHTAERLAALRPLLTTADEPAAVVALAALGADLHVAWTHAVEHDRALAVQLAADVYDYAYHRQRLDLLEWGRTAAGWTVGHPRMPDALAAGAAAAWAAGRLDEAAEPAARGVRLSDGAPTGARAVVQLANLSMFGGRVDEAAAGFDDAAARYRAAGDEVRALMCEISVAHAWNSGGRHREAAALIGGLVDRARDSGNPTVLCWALHVRGDATADVDADGALAAYLAAVEQGMLVDNRLFVALARAGSVALATRHGDAAGTLDDVDRVLEQWEDGGNQAVQWGTLLHLAGLLVRVGAERDGALLAGAVLGARRRRPSVSRDDVRLEETLARVRASLGGRVTDDALAEGAALPHTAVLDHARRAVRTARGAGTGPT